jgi:hypothetical protein
MKPTHCSFDTKKVKSQVLLMFSNDNSLHFEFLLVHAAKICTPARVEGRERETRWDSLGQLPSPSNRSANMQDAMVRLRRSGAGATSRSSRTSGSARTRPGSTPSFRTRGGTSPCSGRISRTPTWSSAARHPRWVFANYPAFSLFLFVLGGRECESET